MANPEPSELSVRSSSSNQDPDSLHLYGSLVHWKLHSYSFLTSCVFLCFLVLDSLGSRSRDPFIFDPPLLPFMLPGDMFTAENGLEEPEWVASERQQFSEFRDKNQDGKMDREETLDWILPADYDHAIAEAKHLLYESDSNKVGASPSGAGIGSGSV